MIDHRSGGRDAYAGQESRDFAAKLDTLTASGHQIAWDGCHKIYWCENQAEEADAKETGYDLYPSSELPRIFEDSCGLKFVHPWSLEEHPLNINQFDGDEAEDVDEDDES